MVLPVALHNERIKEIITVVENGNYKAFAEKIRLPNEEPPYTSVYRWAKKDGGDVSGEYITRILDEYKINFDWWLTGKGEIQKKKTEIISIDKKEYDELRDAASEARGENKVLREQLSKYDADFLKMLRECDEHHKKNHSAVVANKS